MPDNVLVAQSGGPSPVINSSLAGILDACFSSNEFGNVYAAWHGIEGVLLEELIDMRAQPPEELRLLRRTPAAGAIGTCRYKLDSGNAADFDRILEVFIAHDIKYFFYIGGNDSMDTADKVSALARSRGYGLTVAGVPKTIDNDVGDEEFKLVDHTPGYGSAARYWANLIRNANEENRGMSVSECVSVFQAMGRSAGFITAASRLADPEREMPLLMFFAETGFGPEQLADKVDATLRRAGRCIAVIGEGFRMGEIGEATDGFGHVEYGASSATAAQMAVNYLNRMGFPVRGQATGQIPGVLQRCASIDASRTDLEEAYMVGAKAVEIALSGETGMMATILRRPGDEYEAYYGKVELRKVANAARSLPAAWITREGTDVTDDFIRYAAPLIGDGWPDIELVGGLQRFARLNISFIGKKCPEYTPQRF